MQLDTQLGKREWHKCEGLTPARSLGDAGREPQVRRAVSEPEREALVAGGQGQSSTPQVADTLLSAGARFWKAESHFPSTFTGPGVPKRPGSHGWGSHNVATEMRNFESENLDFLWIFGQMLQLCISVSSLAKREDYSELNVSSKMPES